MIISGSYRCRCVGTVQLVIEIFISPLHSTRLQFIGRSKISNYIQVYLYVYIQYTYQNTVIIYKTTGEMVKRILFIGRLRKIRDGKHNRKRTKICIQSGIYYQVYYSLPRIRYDVIRSTNILQFFFCFQFLRKQNDRYTVNAVHIHRMHTNSTNY